jgi:hypothetical protein
MKSLISAIVVASFSAILAGGPSLAQVTNADRACAQDRATVGTGDQLVLKEGKDGQPANLSDKLAKSGGIICPPTNVDNDIHASPPGGGKIEVIPPPGTPQNQPNVQPK